MVARLPARAPILAPLRHGLDNPRRRSHDDAQDFATAREHELPIDQQPAGAGRRVIEMSFAPACKLVAPVDILRRQTIAADPMAVFAAMFAAVVVSVSVSVSVALV